MTTRKVDTIRERNDETQALGYLARATALLRLSVQVPDRVASWDVVVLTAASEYQASIYEMQVESARRRGFVSSSTRTLVVADPDGKRIGSGGATLNALRSLRDAVPDRDPADLKVLLIHAGGDSKRVPWANVLGKSFIPFPVLSDSDHPPLTVFDHQLAISAPIAHRMTGSGMLSFSGDALPLFASARVDLPKDDAMVVTFPVSIAIAEKHGVIVASQSGEVIELLQKASADELIGHGALVRGCAALLDTGIYAVCGESFRSLLALAESEPNPVSELIEMGAECSLYEEIASGFVPAMEKWLRKMPLGERIHKALVGHTLVHSEASNLTFIHFGSSAEVLQHLTRPWGGMLSRRILSECGPGVDPSATACASDVESTTTVGKGSLLFGCHLGPDVRIGNRCAVIGVDSNSADLRLPDNTCLWQVPLRGKADSVSSLLVCCGVDDNPKSELGSATFGNCELESWMTRRGVLSGDLWPEGGARTIWNAKLFPCVSDAKGVAMVMWLLRFDDDEENRLDPWRDARRLSLSELHMEVDARAFMDRQDDLVAHLVFHAIDRSVHDGADRNLSALTKHLSSDAHGEELIKLAGGLMSDGGRIGPGLPESRVLQMRCDLLRSGGDEKGAANAGKEAFRAVHREVTHAVRSYEPVPVEDLMTGARDEVRLPVRFDVAGGWSDTPPYCLERPARVLNIAMTLGGELPVGASVETLPDKKWELVLEDAGGLTTTVCDGESVLGDEGLKDKFALLRTALVLSGYGHGTCVTQGVRVRTWARVPRGSGMGTSSILAASLLTALQRLAGRPSAPEVIIGLVLVLEQRMTTGGGWQDQIGGLVPGIKLISSAPVTPIRPRVERVPLFPEILDEFQQRFVVAFTGIERLAKNVLQIVVGNYLSRDDGILSAIAELVEFAEEGRKLLALGDLDGLGYVMRDAWAIHQVLDPNCSNPEVDTMFNDISDLILGGKLAGAGGGGFMGVMAKDPEAARRAREILVARGGSIKVYDWALWNGETGMAC